MTCWIASRRGDVDFAWRPPRSPFEQIVSRVYLEMGYWLVCKLIAFGSDSVSFYSSKW